MKDKIILFDFCETLANFQTADEFIHYVRNKEKKVGMKIKEFLRLILLKSKFLRVIDRRGKKNINKKLVLWQLKGINYSKLDNYSKEYYFKKVRPFLIKEVLSELNKFKKEGSKIYVVSGGYDLYLKYFIDEFKLEGLICTKIDFRKNICLGKFKGIDCMGGNKVKLLNNHFFKKSLENYFFIVYSDSKEDIPLFFWADKGIIVHNKKVKIDWNKYGLEELIW